MAVFFLAVMLVGCLALAEISIVCVNLIARNWTALDMPVGMLLGIVTFLVVEGFILFVPGDFMAYNGEPMSLKAFIVHHQFAINGIAVITVVTLWRLFRVLRRKVKDGKLHI
jgi:hypothetical protein